jgi:WD40-like Beta Propeller Repeat
LRGGVKVTPWLLPDNRHFLYMNISGGADAGVYVGSLETQADRQQPKKLLPETSPVAFVPDTAGRADSEKGYLLFLRGAMMNPFNPSGTQSGTLTAQAFDAGKHELTGEPIAVAEQVGSFSVSPAGVLVYRGAAPPTAGSAPGRSPLSGPGPIWFDRQGKSLGPAAEPGIYSAITLSPDGKQLATSRLILPNVNNEIWLFDFARAIGKRFSFDSGLDSNPVWSPDGSRIVFSSTQGTGGNWDLYVKPSNGAVEEELLFKSEQHKFATSWSSDSRFLLFHDQRVPGGGLSVLPIKNGKVDPERKPFVFAQDASQGRFSPDMRWVAYVSRESGQSELWVRPFDPASSTGSPPSSGKWMISRGGALSARWRGDGKELFYTAPDGSMMSVEVNTSPGSPVFDNGVPIQRH